MDAFLLSQEIERRLIHFGYAVPVNCGAIADNPTEAIETIFEWLSAMGQSRLRSTTCT